MTKEELEKEAEKYFKSICGDYNEEYERTGKRHYFVGFDIKNAYLASAEPREKQIEIDAGHIRALQKQNGELTDKVNDLEDKLANADYQLEGRDNEIRELEDVVLDLLDNSDESTRLKALNCIYRRKEIKEK